MARAVPISTNLAGNASAAVAVDESLFNQLTSEVTFAQESKEKTQQALKEDIMGSLDKSLEADAWRFAAPRSQLHLLSGTGVPSSRWIESMRQELIESMRPELMETDKPHM